jgi:cell wall-associated NlpC family hydrolase
MRSTSNNRPAVVRGLRYWFPATTALLAMVCALFLALPLGSRAVPAATQQSDLHALGQQLAARIDALQGRIDKLQGSENAAQAELVRQQTREHAIGLRLDAARVKLARTTKQLRQSREVLSARLVAVYKSGQPDIISIVLRSDGFSQMLDRAQYFHDVATQDRRVIDSVIALKRQTHAQTVQLASLATQAQTAVGQVQQRKQGIVVAKTALTAQAGSLSAELRKTRKKIAVIAAQVARQQGPAAVTGPSTTSAPVVVKGGLVSLHSDGLASASSGAPAAIKNAVAAGNQIAKTPYVWGGGHGSFQSSGYDCSGSVSYVLHAAGVLSSPEASGPLESWGDAGPGRYITVYANAGHVFMIVGGVWFDTVGLSGTGSRWQTGSKGTGGFVVRHPAGL